MRLCRFDNDRLGLLEGNRVRDVTAAAEGLGTHRWPLPTGDLAIAGLDALAVAIDRVRDTAPTRPLADVKLLAPVANPAKVIAAPINYEAHRAEAARDRALAQATPQSGFEGFAHPIARLGLFLKASSSVVGPGEGVSLVFPDRRTDHEVELAVVVGRQARNVSRQDAPSVVAGYCIGLDMSVRGTEDRSFRKSPDGYTVLGPWLVTADEVAEPQALDLRVTVNGEVRQASNTRHMTVPIGELIEIASRWFTLYPGDVLLTGTPEGVGPVRAGDVMEAWIEGIGAMTVAVR